MQVWCIENGSCYKAFVNPRKRKVELLRVDMLWHPERKYRAMEKENKLYKRERESAKCPSQCIDLLKNNWTHNVCNCCYCVKSSPYKTKGEKYQYFRNKKCRRENYNLGVLMGFIR